MCVVIFSFLGLVFVLEFWFQDSGALGEEPVCTASKARSIRAVLVNWASPTLKAAVCETDEKAGHQLEECICTLNIWQRVDVGYIQNSQNSAVKESSPFRK